MNRHDEDPFGDLPEPQDAGSAPAVPEAADDEAALLRLLGRKELVQEIPAAHDSLQIRTRISLNKRDWRFRTTVGRCRNGMEVEEARWPPVVVNRTREIAGQEIDDDMRSSFAREALKVHRRRCTEVAAAVAEEIKERDRPQHRLRRLALPLGVALLLGLTALGVWLWLSWLPEPLPGEEGALPEQETTPPAVENPAPVKDPPDSGPKRDEEETRPSETKPAAVEIVEIRPQKPETKVGETLKEESQPMPPPITCGAQPENALSEGTQALRAGNLAEAEIWFRQVAGCRGPYAVVIAKMYDPSWDRAIRPDARRALEYYRIARRQGGGGEVNERLEALLDWAGGDRRQAALAGEIEQLLGQDHR